MAARVADIQVIPAVDLLGDEAVRLEQGDYERVTLRAGDPAELVARFAAAGRALDPRRRPRRRALGRLRPELVAQLVAAAAPAPVQASGGIRSVGDAQALLDAGAERVVVGTAAFGGPGAVVRRRSASALVVAVDVRGGSDRTARLDERSRSRRSTRRSTAASPPASSGSTAPRSTATGRSPAPTSRCSRGSSSVGPARCVAAGGIRRKRISPRSPRRGAEGAVVGRALLEGRDPDGGSKAADSLLPCRRPHERAFSRYAEHQATGKARPERCSSAAREPALPLGDQDAHAACERRPKRHGGRRGEQDCSSANRPGRVARRDPQNAAARKKSQAARLVAAPAVVEPKAQGSRQGRRRPKARTAPRGRFGGLREVDQRALELELRREARAALQSRGRAPQDATSRRAAPPRRSCAPARRASAT